MPDNTIRRVVGIVKQKGLDMMGTSAQQQTNVAMSDHKLLGTLEVKPHDKPRLSLGHFSAARRLKGVAVELSSDPASKDIITDIDTVGDIDDYELVLRVTNNGNSPLTAQVWEL